MDVFRVVKDNVTARQVAEYYGMKIGRNGMACCPFHDDKHPSMKPKTLQKILGHNSLQMTMDLYCHVRESTLTDEMERIANFM